MATTKKYLDLQGLQHLRDQGILVKHNTGNAVSAAAVKVGKDANGHIVIGGALTAADLGLSGALKFIGTTLTALTDGATTNPVKIKQSATDTKGVNHNATSGNVVLYNSKEFIWTGSAWEELGDESSHALKTIKVEGDGTYITGGGTLEENRKLSHKTYTAAGAAAVKIGRDTGGHVVIGGALSIDSAGAHTHPVSSDIPASTFLTSASGTTTKISLNPTTENFVKSYPGVKSNLVTTTITGVSGSTSASAVSGGSTKDIAKAGDPVVYGTANVGDAITVATRAAAQTTVGNANVGTEISITGVSGSTTASYATAGTDIAVAKAGDAVTVATRATSQTTVGNANVGTEISITGVSGSTTASKATAGKAVSVAKAGDAVTVATRAASKTTVGNANVGTELEAVAYNSATPAYTAAYDSTKECLTLTALGSTSKFYSATASTTEIYGVGGTTKIIPAVANGTITPYTFADVDVPKAATATKFTPATTSTTKIYGVGGTTSITPAVANGTITPYTFSNVTVPKAASVTKFNPATTSTTKIYGVGDTTSITPAVAAPDTQTIVPAVANGQLTGSYTVSSVTVPKAATTDTTVATGTLATDGKGGSVMTGLGTATTKAAITSASIQSGTTGDVTVVTEVKSGKNSAAVTISGTAAEKGAHTHEIK